MEQKMNRRAYLKGSALLLGSIPFAGTLFAAADPKKVEVPIYDPKMLVTNLKLPQVKQFNYVNEAKSVKEKVTQTPTKEPADKQFCYNCSLYVSPGYLKDSKEEAGKCPMFANNVVKGEGWCKVWVKGPEKRPAAPPKKA